jgi:signal transduction histidine kinase
MGFPDETGSTDDLGAVAEARRAHRLVEIGSSLVAELDLDAVLREVVEAARELTGARYAALGVLDLEGRELERFIHLGIDEETRQAIGPLPRGRGVLGELIREPRPLRLTAVEDHRHSYGFPPAHPPMGTFLGVPIAIRGEAYGNLYMTEKAGGAEFDAADEEAAATLAGWAAIAISNARLYRSLEERGEELARALRLAESGVDIARAVGGETDLGRVLGLIVRRARALVEARTVLVLMRRGDRLVFAGHAGGGHDVTGLEVPVDDAAVREAIRDRVVQHLPPGSPASAAHLRSRVGAEAALVVPLLFRGRAVGTLVALDPEGGGDFDAEDIGVLEAFAASAAIAIGTAQTVRAERLQQQLEASEAERRRWARELHDGILQSLAAMRINMAVALQGAGEGREAAVEAAAQGTVAALEEQITELSRLINDLRPAPLERLGLAAALASLAEESAARGGFAVVCEVDLDGGLSGEEERGVYRLVQEALNNVVKHADARRAAVVARRAEGAVEVEVRDDGAGFEGDAPGAGRGLVGMRERVAMLGGTIVIDSRPGAGTRITATLPLGDG